MTSSLPATCLVRSDLVSVAPGVQDNRKQAADPHLGDPGVKLLLSRDNYQFGAYIENIFDHPPRPTLEMGGYVGWHHPRTFGVQVNYNL